MPLLIIRSLRERAGRIGPDRAAIVLAVLACAVWHELATRRIAAPGFPLDDAWIHLQYARNLTHGEFAFNPGEPSAGITAPLWTVLLAVVAFVPVSAISGAKLLGVALHAVTACVAYALAREVSGLRTAAVAAGLSVAMNTRLTWGALSGMETALYACLTTLALLLYVRSQQTGRGSLWGLCAGLAGLARPELFALFPILLLPVVHPRGRSRFDRHTTAAAVLWFASCAAAFVLLNFWTAGRPLPNTFYAKTGTHGLWNAVLAGNAYEAARAVSSDALSAWNQAFQWLAGQSLLLMGGWLLGAAVVCGGIGDGPMTSGWVIVASLMLLPLLRGAFAPEPPILAQGGRYIAHLVVLHFVVAAVGVAWLAERVTTRARPWVLAVLVLALVRVFTTNVRDARTYAVQVKAINDMQVRAARWVREHTPPGTLVATNDIGAIGYFSERPVVDTEGLVTPAIVPYRRRGDIVPFLERVRPGIVLVFPRWHPDIANRPDLFREVQRFTVTPRVSAPDDSLVAYTTPW